MSDIIGFLEQIEAGKTTFQPKGPMPADLQEFQNTAAIIKQALDDGYIAEYQSHIVQRQGSDMIDQVRAGKITDAGKELLGH